jgi:hypothetical protein
VHRQKYCSNCGTEIGWADYGIACSGCDSDLVHGQKYCSNCGIEIEWSDEVVHSSLTNQPISSNDIPSWTKQSDKPLVRVRRVTTLILIAHLFIALWYYLSGGISLSGDSSSCNGLYDANILKTYGVFNCPTSYDSAGSDFNDLWLPLVVGFNLIILSILYGYTSYKIHRDEK